MRTFFSQITPDVVGFWASVGCALHCLALPFIVSVSAFSSLAFLDQPYVEESIIVLSLFVGLGSLLPSYFRRHKKSSALSLLALGFCLMGLSRVVSFERWEVLLTSTGASLVATAHLTNHRLCKRAVSIISKHT